MQPGSMLGSRGPAAPGAARSSSALQTMPSLLSTPPPQQSAMQFEQPEPHAPPAMDEFLEQMFSLPAWNEMGAAGGRAPWDNFNAAPGAGTRLSVDAQKLFTMSLLPPGLIGSHPRDLQVGPDSGHIGDSMLFSNDDSLLGARLRGLQDNSPALPSGLGTRGGAGGGGTLVRSPSVGSSGSEGSGGPQSPPAIANPIASAPTWRQPYVGGVPPLPLGLGQAKPESLLRGDSGDAHLLGKRTRDDDDVSVRETHSGSNVRDASQGLFPSFAGSQVTPATMARAAGLQQGNGASAQGLQPGQAVSLFGSPAVAAQAPHGSGVAAISSRPRVRARRGQATDPHSIAERLRRERIAERMKALQELVPNSNKTDKASMLDEIIDYVKFLQLQVKVLSMSRLGGAGAVAPLVADLPPEVGPSGYATGTMGRSNGAPGRNQDGLASALTEREVARLMEDDMGSAMQYLQSKGLCLMPISLATAISSTNARSQGGNQPPQGSGDRQRSESSAAAAGVSNAPLAGGSPSATAGLEGDSSANKSGNTTAAKNKDGRELSGEKTNGGANTSSSKHSPKAKTQFKGKDESQRRSQ